MSRSHQMGGSRASTRAQAHYRSVAGSVATALNMKLPSQHQGLPATIPENGPPSTAFTTNTLVPPRDNFRYPSERAVQASLAVGEKYLAETGLEEQFYTLLSRLMALTTLPYNPYPGFIKKFNREAERFHMFHETDEEILARLGTTILESAIAYIVRPVESDLVWGLPNIVRITNPLHLKKYDWLLRSLTPDRNKIDTQPEYSVQVMAALIGSTVFEGPVYPATHTIQIRLEYVVTGADIQQAVAMFVSSVMMDLSNSDQDGTHVLLGANVPYHSALAASGWLTQFWNTAEMLENKEDFLQSLQEAVTGNRLVTAECLLCMDEASGIYRRGQKQYALNFLEVTGIGQKEGTHAFSEFPLMTLHEGVFFKQSHAEAYLAVHTARDNVIDKLQNTLGPKAAPATKAKRLMFPFQRDPPKRQPVTVRIHGFKLEEDGSGQRPQGWEVTAPIKSSWQKTIVGFHPQAELFESLQYMLLLVGLEREQYGDELLVEICRLLQSTAYRLYLLMQLNKTIREVILKFQGRADSHLVTELYVRYKESLSQLFNCSLQERSSDLITCSRAILSHLDQLTHHHHGYPNSVPLTIKSVEVLKSLNSYTFTLLLGLVEEALTHCPKVQELTERLRKEFPEQVIQPRTPTRDRRDKKKTGVGAGQGVAVYKHGTEEEAILKHDDQVIDVQMCIERDHAPKMIAVESVLMRYMTDTRLDEVWPTFLVDLLSSAQHPPNPFPKAVTMFRQCAQRMDLCYEQNDKLQARMLHGLARLEDADNFIFHIPGCDAHGLQTSISMLDSGTFHQLVPVISQFLQTNFRMRRGPYRVAICCGLSGFSPMYGRIDPYLRQIELDEHCYIRGPDGCWEEATMYYSKIMYEHLLDLYKKQKYFIYGLYMGKEQIRWSVEDILNRKKGYASELERNLQARQPIYLKMFVQMEWRLVPVIKHFKFHFINDDETLFETYFPDDPAGLYRCVFLDKEKACFHFQFGGPPDRSNPFNVTNLGYATRQMDTEILAAQDQQDWLTVHRWLLLRDNVSQGSGLACECWRMLHSVAGQIEYVNTLGRTLQDLVNYVLELRSREKDMHTYYNVTNEEDDTTLVFRLEKLLSRMVMAYRQKVESIASMKSAMAPSGFPSVISAKLKTIMERDEVTKELFLLTTMNTVYKIDEVTYLLRALQDAVAQDVHSISAECQATLCTIEADHRLALQRPSSVASVDLSNPYQYSKRPSAKLPDFANDWS